MFKKNNTNSIVKKQSYKNAFISFLFILTFVLILFNKTDYFIADKIKIVGIDYVSPLTQFISSPVTLVSNAVSRIINIKNTEA